MAGVYIGFLKPLAQDDFTELPAPSPRDLSKQRSYLSESDYFGNARLRPFGNQGYRALRAFTATALRRSINNPSKVSQVAVAYTQPLQYFPPGRVTQVSTPENKRNIKAWVNQHLPSNKLPHPLPPIRTRMPWNP